VRLRQTPQPQLRACHPWLASLKGVGVMTEASVSCGVGIHVVVWASTFVATGTGRHLEQCDVVVGG